MAGDESKTRLLKSLPGADAQLLLFEADLFEPHSFEAAIQGCEFVFLLAAPAPLNANYSQVTELFLSYVGKYHCFVSFRRYITAHLSGSRVSPPIPPLAILYPSITSRSYQVNLRESIFPCWLGSLYCENFISQLCFS